MKTYALWPSFALLLFLFSFTATAQEITSFTLMNAEADTEIGPLTDGSSFVLADLPSNQLSIRANTSGTMKSVVFSLDGEVVMIENRAPYAFFGNTGNDYAPWIPEIGTYTINASAYSLRRGRGTLLDSFTVTVSFTEADPGEEPEEPEEPAVAEIQALILVNADTDEDIGEITEGSTYNLFEIGTGNLNIRAEAGEDVESVIFDYQGELGYQLENVPVYALGGNFGDDYSPWVPDLGANTVTATGYTRNRGRGDAGDPLTRNFEIIDEDPNEEEEPPAELPAVLRMNSGGEAISYNDIDFSADNYFAGNGKSFENNSIQDILATTMDELYKSERSTDGNPASFAYNIPITNGDYEINLHFAEIYWGATGGGPGGTGRRVFDVSIEGQTVLSNYDINAEAGPMTAIIRTFNTTVTDEELNISFNASVDQPKLSALEIFGEGSLITPPATCSWDQLANSSLSKVEAQSVKLNDKLYVIAGFVSGLKITAETEIYDPATDTWSGGAPIPTPVTHMGAVGVGDEIWILAGFIGDHPGVATDKVQIYNTITDSWAEGPDLPNPRGSGAAAYSNGKIHFFGGLLPDRVTDVGEHYILDVNNISAGWQPAADMPNPRNHLSAAAINGKIYAIGGQFGHDNGVSDQAFLDEYDPATDRWTPLADLPSARSHFEPGTMVHNDKIIIVGGRRGGFFFDDVTEYDPATNSWSERCELPTNLLAPSAKVFGDRLIVANGGEGGVCCPNNNTISIAIEPEIINDGLVKVMVYHETNGFRHGSIDAGIAMINEFGDSLNWEVNESITSEFFNTSTLADTDVVVWLNTSGDGLLTAAEQSAFEAFIQGGGGFVGVHAAADTYRDGSWNWYNDLVGAIIQTGPNHTANNTNATMDVVGDHPTVTHLGSTWNKNEEYYYWELNGGYLFSGNVNLLNVRSTGSASYDDPRPITWYKYYDGGRSFYTALGHNAADYSSDENFRTMMREAILWAAEPSEEAIPTSRSDNNGPLIVYPNPATDHIEVHPEMLSSTELHQVALYTLSGETILTAFVKQNDNKVSLEGIASGYYLVAVQGKNVNGSQIIVIE